MCPNLQILSRYLLVLTSNRLNGIVHYFYIIISRKLLYFWIISWPIRKALLAHHWTLAVTWKILVCCFRLLKTKFLVSKSRLHSLTKQAWQIKEVMKNCQESMKSRHLSSPPISLIKSSRGRWNRGSLFCMVKTNFWSNSTTIDIPFPYTHIHKGLCTCTQRL